MPDWCLSIATLNRRDVLLTALRCALAQTRPPSQIVVVDASEDWEVTRDAAARIVADHPGVALSYVQSPVRSSSEQRNIAVRESRADVVFLIDDDSFMFPDCAARIMAVYDADTGGEVAAVAARVVDAMPPAATQDRSGPDTRAIARKSGPGARARLQRALLSTAVGRWINRRLLLQSVEELFIRYDPPRPRRVPPAVAGAVPGVVPVGVIGGVVLTARREIALREPFDTALRYYAAFEDLDVTCRYARHGALLVAPEARLHHFEAAAGRVKRKTVIVFQLLNMAVFLKRHAARPESFLPRYRAMIARRLLAETLKDLLSGRWSLPQARGALLARRMWREVWALAPEEIDRDYPAIQKRILDGL